MIFIKYIIYVKNRECVLISGKEYHQIQLKITGKLSGFIHHLVKRLERMSITIMG